jgi:hypothetical protein
MSVNKFFVAAVLCVSSVLSVQGDWKTEGYSLALPIKGVVPESIHLATSVALNAGLMALCEKDGSKTVKAVRAGIVFGTMSSLGTFVALKEVESRGQMAQIAVHTATPAFLAGLSAFISLINGTTINVGQLAGMFIGESLMQLASTGVANAALWLAKKTEDTTENPNSTSKNESLSDAQKEVVSDN